MTTSAAAAASSTLRSGEERARPPNLLLQQDQRSQYSVIVILVVMLFQNTNKRLRRRAREIGIASLKANDTYRWRHQRLNKYFSVIGYIVPRLDKSSYFVAHAANPINGSMTRTYGLAHGKMVGSLQPQDGWVTGMSIHLGKPPIFCGTYVKIHMTNRVVVYAAT